MLPWTRDEFPFKRKIDDRLPGKHLFEQLSEPFDRSHLCQGPADNLLRLQPEKLRLSIVESQVAEILRVKQSQSDGSRPVDCFNLRELSLRLFRLVLQRFPSFSFFRSVGNILTDDKHTQNGPTRSENRTVAVGPPNILQLPISNDWNDGVFVINRRLVIHDPFEIGANDLPG